jgi:glycosyltransferase involved in cell wall biosynthesis
MEVLLEALSILHRQEFPVRLRAVGAFEEPGYALELAIRVKRLGLTGLVDWIGFTRDVNAELAKMDLLVLPSLFGEGLPMVVLEAMAAGVPVVATRVEGIPEALRDGQDGVLVQPGDPQELAAAIAKVVGGQLDWSALRHSALGRHAEQFSDLAMAAGVAAVYHDILSLA